MTDHLPECPTLDFPPFVDEDWDEGPCICERLRACEQRVRDEHQADLDHVSYVLGQTNERQRSVLLIADAYAAGVQAAWEAVADLTPFVFAYQTWISGDYGYDEGPWVKKENALDAIDALREEKP